MGKPVESWALETTSASDNRILSRVKEPFKSVGPSVALAPSFLPTMT